MSRTWFRRFGTGRRDGIRIVLFPHAGGSASAYLALSRTLTRTPAGTGGVTADPADVPDVVAVQYPGRQDRHHEPAYDDIGALADRLTEEVMPLTDRPFAFFGHSMGAVLAYEVARRLEQRSAPTPERLFLSARSAPRATPREQDQVGSDEELLERMRRLGGTAAGIFDEPELLALAMPALRADYRAVGSYAWTPGAPLNIPFTVLVGDSDPVVTVEGARAWQGFSAARCEVRVFPGGHFYLDDHTPEVAELIERTLGVPRREPAPDLRA
ncbi:thioesterase [Streptomyces mashuensis]|uniref:Thioesterase n=1 Tax=Streptomyces mashuensis TaxID=33904 RepID=A0A919B7C6_9ACTN|nr:alpha/beta fold hydrolase [Streptomyces mashuensis]GHF62881.1 thioesterase [Streptomyces mashuensis]